MTKLWNKISIRFKIYGTTAVYQILFLFISILGIIGLLKVQSELQKLRTVYETALESSIKISHNLLKIRNLTILAVSTNQANSIDSNYEQILLVQKDTFALIEKIESYLGKQTVLDLGEGDLVQEAKKLGKEFKSMFRKEAQLIQALRDIKKEALIKKDPDLLSQAFSVQTSITPSNLLMVEKLESFDQIVNKIADKRKEEIEGITSGVRLILIAGYFISSFIGILLTVALVGGVIGPIRKAEKMANNFAEGNLSVKETHPAKDEIGHLISALNGASDNLQMLVKRIGDSADNVASSAEEMSATSQSLADGASNQAASLEETASAITEMIESINQVAQNSKDQASESQHSIEEMAKLAESIQKVTKNSNVIKSSSDSMLLEAEKGQKQITETVSKMEAITESSNQIKEITVVINEIADQTNLLALNAAIEAARAGDSGRGFAVVAEEISKLAARSQEATKQIEKLISDSIDRIMDGKDTISALVAVFSRILNQSREATKFSEEILKSATEQNLQSEKVMLSVTNMNNLANFIAEATKEQESSSREIASSVEQVNGIAQSNAASSEEMASSTINLARLSEQLNELISNFNLS